MFSVTPVAPRLWWHNIYTTETTLEGWGAFEQVKMSKEYQVKSGSRIEPVIFEPRRGVGPPIR